MEKSKEGENHAHAWKGTWDRPVKVDEDSFDPLTIARMTDHNVRGEDEESSENPEETTDGKAPPPAPEGSKPAA